VREEELGHAGPETLEQKGIVVDGGPPPDERRDRYVTEGVGRDLTHVDQALERLRAFRARGEQ
jgi:hypothetical protein